MAAIQPSIMSNRLTVSSGPRRAIVLRASGDNGDKANPFTGTSSSSTSPDALPANEARLEAVEGSIRAGRRAAAAKKQNKPMTIRGVNDSKKEEASSTFAKWKEGQLFPEGFDSMPLSQKINELWVGQRGFLFWSNKIAYGAAITLGISWILFRIVFPAIGLYQLAGDLVPAGF